MTHVKCEITFIGLHNEVWEVGSVLNQKQREHHLSVSYFILNPHVSPLASHLYRLFQIISNMCIEPIILNMVTSFLPKTSIDNAF